VILTVQARATSPEVQCLVLSGKSGRLLRRVEVNNPATFSHSPVMRGEALAWASYANERQEFPNLYVWYAGKTLLVDTVSWDPALIGDCAFYVSYRAASSEQGAMQGSGQGTAQGAVQRPRQGKAPGAVREISQVRCFDIGSRKRQVLASSDVLRDGIWAAAPNPARCSVCVVFKDLTSWRKPAMEKVTLVRAFRLGQ
jgi:hypothetical protein